MEIAGFLPCSDLNRFTSPLLAANNLEGFYMNTLFAPGNPLRNTVLLLIFLFFSSLSQAQEIPPGGILDLTVEGKLAQPDSVELRINCRSILKFTNGVLLLNVTQKDEKDLHATVLWRGSSDQPGFNQSFTHQLPLPIGKKIEVNATIEI